MVNCGTRQTFPAREQHASSQAATHIAGGTHLQEQSLIQWDFRHVDDACTCKCSAAILEMHSSRAEDAAQNAWKRTPRSRKLEEGRAHGQVVRYLSADGGLTCWSRGHAPIPLRWSAAKEEFDPGCRVLGLGLWKKIGNGKL